METGKITPTPREIVMRAFPKFDAESLKMRDKLYYLITEYGESEYNKGLKEGLDCAPRDAGLSK